MNTTQWLDKLAASKTSVVLVTVLETKGSIPRETGTKMLVSQAAIHGTIGGGHLEYKCIAMAKARLDSHNGHDWQRDIQRFPLGASLGQCCGGVVVLMLEYLSHQHGAHSWQTQLRDAVNNQQDTLLVTPLNSTQEKFLVSREQVNSDCFPAKIRDNCQAIANKLLASNTETSTLLCERVKPSSDSHYFFEKYSPSCFHIMLFGAGHVGRALVKALDDIDCTINWVDSRADQFPKNTHPHTQPIISESPVEEVASAPANTCFVIMTHNHQLDQDLCEVVLARDDFRYCGVIGSMTKRHKFEHRLRAKGITETKLQTLKCPIGVSGISGKAPAVIAIAVTAELLALH